MEQKQIPLNIQITEAKNELKYRFQEICVKYQLPSPICDMILADILRDEQQAHISLLCEQYTTLCKEKTEGVTDGNTRSEHENAD